MWISVSSYFFVITLLPVSSTYLSKEIRYECGPHGRFEYCIDAIPGCVIGCHCHPGYYFDTDTKICEPNIKLTQDFRRHRFAEPTYYDRPTFTPPTTETILTPLPSDIQNNTVDEIPKETDELGDWLYNQFFKTIESQVINKTKTNSKEKLPKPTKRKPQTRRIGGDRSSIVNKRKRKTRKSMRSGKKKKHMKVHGLRRKLLRITEDDSLFDSDSGSDYSDASTIESDSEIDYSDEISSGDRSEGGGGGGGGGGKKSSTSDDKDHGHKKVIIFNRRPRPPLPSFIFLPSMDTPYYPPIGLPPPPLPMYPMVPVPPVAPPMFLPFPGCQKTDDAANATTTSTAPPSTHPTTKEPIEEPTQAASDEPTPGTEESPQEPPTTEAGDTTPETLRQGDRRTKLHRGRQHGDLLISGGGRPGKLKRGPKSKLLQKIQNKMKERRNRVPLPDTDNLKEGEDGDVPNLTDVLSLSQSHMSRKRLLQSQLEQQQIPKLEDVDFKYLSELIHRVNQSDIKSRLPPLPFDLNNDLQELQKLRAQQSRRTFGFIDSTPSDLPVQPVANQHTRTLHKQSNDDVYYTNLGRQIASMIRNVDSKIENQFNKVNDQTNHPIQYHSVLNENSYSMPKSYWERSVRSPLFPKEEPLNNYLDETRTLRHSSDKSLLNLENEVELFASTPAPLSLLDLENILNTMEKVHTHIQLRQPVTSTKQSNVNLNINLLPKFLKTDNIYRRINIPEKVEYFTKHANTPLPSTAFVHPTNATNTSILHKSVGNDYNLRLRDYWLYRKSPGRIQSQPKTKVVLVAQDEKPVQANQVFYNEKSFHKKIQHPVHVVHPNNNNNVVKNSGNGHLHYLNSMPPTKPKAKKSKEPKVYNYNSLNYFSGNKNHYMFEETSYPFLSPFKRSYSEPSYFHHHLHTFENFD